MTRISDRKMISADFRHIKFNNKVLNQPGHVDLVKDDLEELCNSVI